MSPFYTGHEGTPYLNALMIFAAEYLVYLVPIALLALWFLPEKEQANAGIRLPLANPGFAIENGKAKAVFIFMTIVVSLGVSYVLGQFYSHPAPYMLGYETLLIDAPENSFPSQHTTVMFAFAWPIFYLQDRWREGVVALGIAALVGISRVYVGVHFPLDIIGAVGASLLGFALVYAVRGLVMDVASQCIHLEERVKTVLLRGF